PLSDPPAPASDRTQRMDLVMEGGGVKGIALAGALEVLEERGYRVNRAAGSSAGSIAAALATAGIPAATIVEILRETDYRRFEDGPWWTRPLIGKGLSILLHNGIHRGRYLTAWLEEQLASHGAPGRTGTFADLLYRDPEDTTAPSQPMAPVGTPATQTPATSSPTAQTPTPRSPGTQIPTTAQPQPHRYRLVVTASDLTSGRLRFLPTDADAFGAAPGQLRVVDAVRASTSIPFFFRPVKWKNAYGKPAWLVDGGLLSNFPVSVFDRPADEVPRWPTFGIKLSARQGGRCHGDRRPRPDAHRVQARRGPHDLHRHRRGAPVPVRPLRRRAEAAVHQGSPGRDRLPGRHRRSGRMGLRSLPRAVPHRPVGPLTD